MSGTQPRPTPAKRPSRLQNLSAGQRAGLVAVSVIIAWVLSSRVSLPGSPAGQWSTQATRPSPSSPPNAFGLDGSPSMSPDTAASTTRVSASPSTTSPPPPSAPAPAPSASSAVFELGAACPALVAAVAGGDSTVAAAFKTASYTIDVCRSPGGAFFYLGVANDDPSQFGVMGAELDIGGYTATVGSTRYSVSPARLVIATDGATVLTERVTDHLP